MSIIAVLDSPRRAGRWLTDPDVSLMLRVSEDDEAAFAELVRRYNRRVLGFFRRQMVDRGEAEDLTQEVFLRIYRYRRRYQPRARFATWIFFVARNVARNARRTQRRHPSVQLEAHSEALPGMERLLLDEGETPSSSLERTERQELIRAAVAELGGRKRAALELHQFQDCSYAEVAQLLRMTAKAAKSLLYRARLELRGLLEPLRS